MELGRGRLLGGGGCVEGDEGAAGFGAVDFGLGGGHLECFSRLLMFVWRVLGASGCWGARVVLRRRGGERRPAGLVSCLYPLLRATSRSRVCALVAAAAGIARCVFESSRARALSYNALHASLNLNTFPRLQCVSDSGSNIQLSLLHVQLALKYILKDQDRRRQFAERGRPEDVEGRANM